MGGMAAFIPSRRDAEVNRIAFAKVCDDKQREATDGFDGTWVETSKRSTRGLAYHSNRLHTQI